MNETYVECMVKRKPSTAMKLLKYITIMFAAVCLIMGFMGFLVPLIAGIVLAVLAYFATLNAEIEYEYLYVDRQLTVDKVLNRTRRKKVAAYDLERMEILAPVKSYHLDSFKNRTVKVVDYSSGIVKQPDIRFAFYYDGKSKVIFEPNLEMIKAIGMVAPRKVFRD